METDAITYNIRQTRQFFDWICSVTFPDVFLTQIRNGKVVGNFLVDANNSKDLLEMKRTLFISTFR